MLILEWSQGCYGRTDGSVTISLRNFVGEGIIKVTAMSKIYSKDYFYFSELRLTVRGSLARKDRGPHEHDYGEESYDEEEDIYSKTCKTCGHIDTYEKM